MIEGTFDPRTPYSAVVMQQGRVAIDADINENTALGLRAARRFAVDLIGRFGAPAGDAGFAVSVSDGAVWVGPGRAYVDGIACANRDAQRVTAPEPPYVVYLDVWERHVAAADDDELREPALEGPDTTVRQKTVWRVGATADLCCRPAAARMSTRSRYEGSENQLYRVDIHDGGTAGEGATFRWSRDNGSVRALLIEFGPELVGAARGEARSDPHPVSPGKWVELESGIEVCFGGDDAVAYQTGDYWLVPPRAEETGPAAPTGVQHHCVRLAEVTKDGEVIDLRKLF